MGHKMNVHDWPRDDLLKHLKGVEQTIGQMIEAKLAKIAFVEKNYEVTPKQQRAHVIERDLYRLFLHHIKSTEILIQKYDHDLKLSTELIESAKQDCEALTEILKNKQNKA